MPPPPLSTRPPVEPPGRWTSRDAGSYTWAATGLGDGGRGVAGTSPPYPRILDSLTADERETLLAKAVTKEVRAGQIVNAQEDPRTHVSILRTGRVKAYFMGIDGRSLTFAYWGDGMLLGTPSLSISSTFQWTTEALTKCTILLIDRNDFIGLIDSSPKLARFMIELLEFKSILLSHLVQVLGMSRVDDRLAFVLSNLSRLYGSDVPEGRRIDMVVTHSEIADMIGSSRQWASRALKKLIESKKIVVEKRQIIVTDRIFT
jgi:CRP/FNR family transcriptional regulator, cyclic AMP receptor protein